MHGGNGCDEARRPGDRTRGRAHETAPPAPDVRTERSEDLLGPDGTLVIVHAGERYLLRRTRNGRLILTK